MRDSADHRQHVPVMSGCDPLVFYLWHNMREQNMRELREEGVLRYPRRLEAYEVRNEKMYCEFHNSRGHDTKDCNALKDELERLARDRDVKAFVEKYVTNHATNRSNYGDNGRRNNFRGNSRGNRDQWGRNDANQRNRSPPPRAISEQPSAPVALVQETEQVINVISGGIASGGDTDRKRRGYIYNTDRAQCFKIENKFDGVDVPITFTAEDYGDTRVPHDDAVVLSLRMSIPKSMSCQRVKRMLVDTGSSAEIL